MKRLSIAIAIMATALSASAQLPPLVQSALAAVKPQLDRWAFTQTTVEDGSKTVERFDPSRPEGRRWELLLKDGKTPSRSDLDSYAKEKAGEAKHGKGSRQNKGEDDIAAMIRPGSLHLVRESPADALYEFRLAVPENAKEAQEMIDSMKGRLTIAKNGPWLQTMELESEKPMKPFVGVKIERMYTKLTFLPPSAGVPPLLGEIRATIRGRALVVKSLNHDSVITFSDYRQVAAP